jgi:hypothetical protein
MHIKKSYKTPGIAIFLTSLTVSMPTVAEVFAPEGIRSGSVIYYPYVALSIGNDDNLYSQENNSKSSSLTSLNTGVNLEILQSESLGFFKVSADATAGFYGDSSADNFEDGTLSAGYNYQISEKSLIDFNVGVKQLHDARTSATLLTNNAPDVYQDNTLDGEWYYGENNAEGADLLLSFNLTDKSYSTNSAVNDAKERAQTEISGLNSFPLAPNTRIRLSARYSTFDYDTKNTLDSTQIRALVGIEWQASAQTLLTIDVGSQKKEFDLNPNSDDSENAWEVSMAWTPEDYNRVDLTASNDFAESTTAASYLTNQSVNLTWRYGWKDYIVTVISLGNTKETSVNPTSKTVKNITTAALSAEFHYSQSVKFTAGVNNTEVDSDVAGDSSDKNVITVGLTTAF